MLFFNRLRFENCGRNITLNGTPEVTSEGTALPSPSSTPQTAKTYVAVGEECQIICNEKAGFYLLKNVAPTVYKDAPTKISCGRVANDDGKGSLKNSSTSSNNNNFGNKNYIGVNDDDDALTHHAVWMVASNRAVDMPLDAGKMPLCYRRHCPKSQLNAGANFKCVTQTGPDGSQVVTEGENCTFLGCRSE